MEGRKVRARISCGVSGTWAVDGWKSWPTVVGLDWMRKRQRKRRPSVGGRKAGREGARGAMCNKPRIFLRCVGSVKSVWIGLPMVPQDPAQLE